MDGVIMDSNFAQSVASSDTTPQDEEEPEPQRRVSKYRNNPLEFVAKIGKDTQFVQTCYDLKKETCIDNRQ